MKYYTINEIIEFSKNKNIEDWVHEFLISSGDNTALSEGLKKNKRYWIGPIEVNLNILQRCCGPEKNMEFVEPEEIWNKNVDRILQKMKTNYEIAPLLVEYKNNIFSIRDGNHRLEALKKNNYKKYWTIIWCNNEIDFKNITSSISK